MELTTEQKTQIVNKKIEAYQAQVYNAKLDLACAEALNDEKWKEEIREGTKRLMQIITILEQELDAI